MRRLLATREYHKMMEIKKIQLKEVPKKKKVREFHLPKLNFRAKTFYEMVELEWETPVGPYNPPDEAVFKVHTINYKGPTKYQKLTVPPLLSHMSAADIEDIVYSRVTADFECHTQSCERGVALTAASVKRRRTENTQLRTALSTVAAREGLSRSITVKRFKEDFGAFIQ